MQGLCNVSTTSSTNPEEVLSELRRALISKGISCKQKGWVNIFVSVVVVGVLRCETTLLWLRTCLYTFINILPNAMIIRRPWSFVFLRLISLCCCFSFEISLHLSLIVFNYLFRTVQLNYFSCIHVCFMPSHFKVTILDHNTVSYVSIIVCFSAVINALHFSCNGYSYYRILYNEWEREIEAWIRNMLKMARDGNSSEGTFQRGKSTTQRNKKYINIIYFSV